MKNGKIGVGLIGASEGGWAVTAHIPALLKLKDRFEIFAVSTTRLDTARATASKFDIPNAFDNENDLVNFPDIELVVVAVKVPHHYQLVKSALAAGKMVYCEWPLGNGTQEAEEFAASALEKGIRTFAGLQARALPQLKYVKDFIANEYIGRVISTTVIGSGGIWGPTIPSESQLYLLDPKNGATMLQIPVGHLLDGLAFCLAEFAEVNAVLSRQLKEVRIANTNKTVPQLTNDQIIISGLLANGAAASVHFRGGSSSSVNLYWEIKGTEGEIIITSPSGNLQFGRLTVQYALTGQAQKNLEIPGANLLSEGGTPGTDARPSFALHYVYKALYEDVCNGTFVVPDFAAAVTRHRLLNTIEKAAANTQRELFR